MDDAALVLWGSLLGAVLLTGEPTSWRVLRHAITIVHEGGHAVAAVLVGRRLAGIRLHSDTSGVTVSSGRPTGPGMVLTAAAGYPAPCLLGLGFAALLARGWVEAMLWLCAVSLLLMLAQIRNLFGVLALLLAGSAVAAVIWFGTPWAGRLFGAAVCWLLLVGGLRAVIELQRSRRRGRARSSDADQLAWLTGIGGVLWVVLFWLVGAGSLAGSGWLLLR